MTRQIAMEKTAAVRKKVTIGETTTEAIIPTGMTVPNITMETGAVADCALMDADRLSEIFFGRNLLKMELKKSPRRRIPARAP